MRRPARLGPGGRGGGSRRPPSTPGGSSTGRGRRRARSARSTSRARRLHQVGGLRRRGSGRRGSARCPGRRAPWRSRWCPPSPSRTPCRRTPGGRHVVDALRDGLALGEADGADLRVGEHRAGYGVAPRALPREVVEVQQVVLDDPRLVVRDVLELQVVGDVAERPDAVDGRSAGGRRPRSRPRRRRHAGAVEVEPVGVGAPAGRPPAVVARRRCRRRRGARAPRRRTARPSRPSRRSRTSHRSPRDPR